MEASEQDDLWQIDFGDIELADEIGQGQFGKVYRGSLLGSDVAVKNLLRLEEADAKYVERETALLRQLAHPNIVQFIGLSKHQGSVWLVTEFCSGGNLQSLLWDASKPLSWARRVHFSLDCCQALAFIHSKSLMHRDVKSDNLLLDGNGRVKLCDFGFARKVDKKLEQMKGKKMAAMTIAGTDQWMAPEVILGMPYAQAADMFSFGVTVTEMIVRKKPEERRPRNAFEFEVEEFRSACPSDCPEELVALVLACCKYEPSQRPEAKVLIKGLKELYKLVKDRETDNVPEPSAPVVAPAPTPAPVVEQPEPALKEKKDSEEPARAPPPPPAMAPVTIVVVSDKAEKPEPGPYAGLRPVAEDVISVSMNPTETGLFRELSVCSATPELRSRLRWITLQDAVVASSQQGWLKCTFADAKKEGKFYFVLVADTLFYWKANKKLEKNVGRIVLDKSCELAVAEIGKKKFELVITNWKKGQARLRGTMQELQAWHTALSNAQSLSKLDLRTVFVESTSTEGRTDFTKGHDLKVFAAGVVNPQGTVLLRIDHFGIRVLGPFLEDVILEIPMKSIAKWQISTNEMLEMFLNVPGAKKPVPIQFVCSNAADVFNALEQFSGAGDIASVLSPRLKAQVDEAKSKRSSVSEK